MESKPSTHERRPLLRRRVLVSGGLALAACLAGAGLLGYRLWLSTKREVELRLDPFELNFYADWPALPPAQRERPRVLFFGDSRARSWPLFESKRDFEYVNRGIGYQTTEQIRGRMERDLTPLRPDIVVLQAGVNDLNAIALVPQLGDRVVRRCKDNLQAIVSRAASLGSQVILMTIFSTARPSLLRSLLLPGNLQASIAHLNRWLRRLGSAQVTIFESGAVLDDSGGYVRPGYQRDFMHVNSAAYEALDAALRPWLARVARRPRPVAKPAD